MSHQGLSDLHGILAAGAEATQHAAEIAEAMHARISPLGARAGTDDRARGISGFVYRVVQRTAALVASMLGRRPAGGREGLRPGESRGSHVLRSVVNGVSGDHLAVRDNALAISMTVRWGGKPLALDPAALRATIADPSPRVLVLIHGLCMSDSQWRRRGHDHGAALEKDLGYTPVYLHYNSGLHVHENGALLARQLEALSSAWPVEIEDLTLLCHSMGGLVARSACHQGMLGRMRWLSRLRNLVFLGTPHLGSPVERAGNRVHRALAGSHFTAPLARLGRLRSAGITDLRFGRVTELGLGSDRFEAPAPDAQVPLPAGVRCFSAAASLGRRAGDLRDHLIGDGLVSVRSALALSDGSPEREWVGYGMGHLDLLGHPEAYRRIRGWLARTNEG